MSDFFEKHGLILSEVFWYMERSKNLKRYILHNHAKRLVFLRRFHLRDTFLDIEKSNSKRLFSNDFKCKLVTRG